MNYDPTTPEGVAGLLIIVVVFIVPYLLPALIANERGHRNLVPLAIINVLLGWTGIAWVLTLAWAYWNDVDPASRAPEQGPEAVVKDPEGDAASVFREAKRLLSIGDKARTIELLKEIVSEYPETRAAELARKSLATSE